MEDGEALGSGYVLHEVLGQGAVGTVRRATRKVGGMQLAAKLLDPHLDDNPQLLASLLRETETLRKLRHESIVGLIDVVYEQGRLTLLMELVFGPNLRVYLGENGGRLLPRVSCLIAQQIASALAEAHEQGVIHLDVKPENILVEIGTDPVRVKLTDFGVAVSVSDRSKPQPPLGSTTGYVAPELGSSGRPTSGADVWALGVVTYEMLTGSRPQQAGAPSFPLFVPASLQTLLTQCLHENPKKRPPAHEVAARLLAILPEFRRAAGSGSTPLPAGERTELKPPPDGFDRARKAQPASGTVETRRPPRRRTLVLVASAVIAAVTAGMVVTALTQGDGADPSVAPSGTGTSSVPAPPLPVSAAPLPSDTLVVAVADGAQDSIIAVNRDGSSAHVLISGDGLYSPSVSPDRQTIVYLQGAAASPTPRVMSADGNGDRPLLSAVDSPCTHVRRAAWNGTGDLLVVMCLDENLMPAGLYVIRTDGSQPRSLLNANIRSPTWSAGDRIVYASVYNDTKLGGALWAVDPEGGLPSQLTSGTGALDSGPSWSPDGRQILFLRHADVSTSGLWIMDANGNGAHPIVVGDVTVAAWSPDGQSIAFIGALGEPAVRVWVVGIDGKDPQPLVGLPAGPLRGIAWGSP